jgi:hypothetical protein
MCIGLSLSAFSAHASGAVPKTAKAKHVKSNGNFIKARILLGL